MNVSHLLYETLDNSRVLRTLSTIGERDGLEEGLEKGARDCHYPVAQFEINFGSGSGELSAGADSIVRAGSKKVASGNSIVHFKSNPNSEAHPSIADFIEFKKPLNMSDALKELMRLANESYQYAPAQKELLEAYLHALQTTPELGNYRIKSLVGVGSKSISLLNDQDHVLKLSFNDIHFREPDPELDAQIFKKGTIPIPDPEKTDKKLYYYEQEYGDQPSVTYEHVLELYQKLVKARYRLLDFGLDRPDQVALFRRGNKWVPRLVDLECVAPPLTQNPWRIPEPQVVTNA